MALGFITDPAEDDSAGTGSSMTTIFELLELIKSITVGINSGVGTH